MLQRVQRQVMRRAPGSSGIAVGKGELQDGKFEFP